MNVGESKLTTNPTHTLRGENGEFRVSDFYGNIETYFCSEIAIVSIKYEGVDGKNKIPLGMYSVEKVSEKSSAEDTG